MNDVTLSLLCVIHGTDSKWYNRKCQMQSLAAPTLVADLLKPSVADLRKLLMTDLLKPSKADLLRPSMADLLLSILLFCYLVFLIILP